MTPPLIQGGQGRTAQQLESSARTLLRLSLLFVALAAVLWLTS